jgi:hypothetical protein
MLAQETSKPAHVAIINGFITRITGVILKVVSSELVLPELAFLELVSVFISIWLKPTLTQHNLRAVDALAI